MGNSFPNFTLWKEGGFQYPTTSSTVTVIMHVSWDVCGQHGIREGCFDELAWNTILGRYQHMGSPKAAASKEKIEHRLGYHRDAFLAIRCSQVTPATVQSVSEYARARVCVCAIKAEYSVGTAGCMYLFTF